MNEKVLCILVCILCALCDQIFCQSSKDELADAIVYEYDTPDQNGYKYRFETSNGIKRAESGIFIEENGELKLQVEGTYQYLRPDGKLQSVFYTAGENGYRPVIKSENEILAVMRPPMEAKLKAKVGLRIGSSVVASLVGGGLG